MSAIEIKALEACVLDATGMTLDDFIRDVFIDNSTTSLARTNFIRLFAEMVYSGSNYDTIIKTIEQLTDLAAPNIKIAKSQPKEHIEGCLARLFNHPELIDKGFEFMVNNAQKINLSKVMLFIGDKPTHPLCRDQQGELRRPEDLKVISRSKDTARAFVRSAFEQDDLEAIDHFLAVPEIAAHLPPHTLDDLFKLVLQAIKEVPGAPAGSHMNSRIYHRYGGDVLGEYWQTLDNAPVLRGGRAPVEFEQIFNPEVLRLAPEVFIDQLSKHKLMDKGQVNTFIYRMHQAGLPCYPGYLLVSRGPFYHLDNKDRAPNYTMMIDDCLSKKSKSGFVGLLATVPISAMVEHSRRDEILLLVHGLTGDPEYVRHMASLKSRGKAFATDLNL